MKSERKGNRILLVDDETDITTLFKIALEDAGFIVHAYNDPLIALSEFKPGYYDLVILDIKMKEMNGFELYAEIRKADNQIKFCFITAGEMYYNEVRDEEQGLYCKVDTERFLQKPISNDDLIKRINKIIL
jgi:DNA-binding response OmpR family regulator